MSKPQPHRFVAKLGNDELIFETGVLAGQAGGAVILRSGDSLLLTTATASKNAREGIDFFPLSVEFEEKIVCRRTHPRQLLSARRPPR